ncbi:MAG: hypothetical protein Q4B60_07655 [Erysipelotrichaceae bacterium]|nr:hypothetical protein [Erysipelotrichaceae bacterium]
MKMVWNFINEQELSVKKKTKYFLIINTVLNALIGLAIWLLIGRLFLKGLAWALCFVGYPAVFAGLIGGSLYLYNHDF